MAAVPNHDELAQRLLIGKTLGSGTYAIVHRARFDDQTVALKVLLPHHVPTGRDDCPVKMFLREGELLHQLKHSNILRCLAVLELPPSFPGLRRGYVRPTWALVLELLEGGSLSRLMQKQMLAPWKFLYDNATALEWSTQIAAGLAYLHGCSPPIIHRDIKMENAMLASPPGGRALVVKLADLGLHSQPNLAKGGTKQPLLRGLMSRGSRRRLLSASACSRPNNAPAGLPTSPPPAPPTPSGKAPQPNHHLISGTGAVVPVNAATLPAGAAGAATTRPITAPAVVQLADGAAGAAATASVVVAVDSSDRVLAGDAVGDVAGGALPPLFFELPDRTGSLQPVDFLGNRISAPLRPLVVREGRYHYQLPWRGAGENGGAAGGPAPTADIFRLSEDGEEGEEEQEEEEEEDKEAGARLQGQQGQEGDEAFVVDRCAGGGGSITTQTRKLPHQHHLYRGQQQQPLVSGPEALSRSLPSLCTQPSDGSQTSGLGSTARGGGAAGGCTFRTAQQVMDPGEALGGLVPSQTSRPAGFWSQAPSRSLLVAAAAAASARSFSEGVDVGNGTLARHGAKVVTATASSTVTTAPVCVVIPAADEDDIRRTDAGLATTAATGGGRGGELDTDRSVRVPGMVNGDRSNRLARHAGVGYVTAFTAAPTSSSCVATSSCCARSAACTQPGCRAGKAATGSGISACGATVAVGLCNCTDLVGKGATCSSVCGGGGYCTSAAAKGLHHRRGAGTGAGLTAGAQPGVMVVMGGAGGTAGVGVGGHQEHHTAWLAKDENPDPLVGLSGRNPCGAGPGGGGSADPWDGLDANVMGPPCLQSVAQLFAEGGGAAVPFSVPGQRRVADVLDDYEGKQSQARTACCVQGDDNEDGECIGGPAANDGKGGGSGMERIGGGHSASARPGAGGPLRVTARGSREVTAATVMQGATSAAVTTTITTTVAGAACGIGCSGSSAAPRRSSAQSYSQPHHHKAQVGCPTGSRPATSTEVELGFGMIDGSALEVVYCLTGETGSCMTMAPEIRLQQPYNEKIDVYAFGVVLYELWSRSLLAVSHVGTRRPDLPYMIHKCDDWPDLIVSGYRPARPDAIPGPVWELISECWDADPLLRPTMAAAEARLRRMATEQAEEVMGLASGKGGKKLTGLGAAGHSKDAAGKDAANGEAGLAGSDHALPAAPDCQCSIM